MKSDGEKPGDESRRPFDPAAGSRQLSAMASSPSPRAPVIIVGGGFSGAMLAARLAETGQDSLVVAAAPELGRGVAYSTPFEGHLLNVRSNRMSAVDGRPGDFVDWLKAHRPDLAAPEDFAPRRVYGDYVQARLAAVEAAHPGRIGRRIDTVTGLRKQADGWSAALASGERLAGRAVVLATGNPAPRTASGEAGGRVLSDPWAPGALDRIGDEDDVIIVGTGLTMVDMVQALDARGWRGRALAVSRRGLMPRAHGEHHDPAAALPAEAREGPVSRRLAAARRLADQEGWREVMEGYRPITAELWMQADMDQRRRMVRHLRPWWDVHRHRIAARIDRFLKARADEGRLTVHAGRAAGVEASDDAVTLRIRPRGGGGVQTLSAPWLLDCTGPGHDAAADPLTGPLIAAGQARLDPLRLGLDLDADGRVVDAGGQADPALFVLGPPARAAFWETIAVPDIRRRIEDVTRALAD